MRDPHAYAWVTDLSVNDLLVRADRMPGQPAVSRLGGAVTLKESGG